MGGSSGVVLAVLMMNGSWCTARSTVGLLARVAASATATSATSRGTLAPAWRCMRLRGGGGGGEAAPTFAKVTWRRLVAASAAEGDAPVARSSHEVSLAGGKVLLFGGEHTPRVPIDAHVWALEQQAGGAWAWQKLVSHGEAPPPRIGHAQAAVGTRLYVMGGRQGEKMDETPLSDLFCFDTATSQWECVAPAPDSAPPPTPRSYHRMVSAPVRASLAHETAYKRTRSKADSDIGPSDLARPKPENLSP